MQVRYLSLHKLLGVKELADDDDTAVYTSNDPELEVYLTENPVDALSRINLRHALANVIMSGVFRPSGKSPEEALDTAIAELEEERKPSGVYVVFDGATEVKDVTIGKRRAIGNVDVTFDAIDTAAVQANFQLVTARVLTALTLELSTNADYRTEHVGTAVVLMDGDREVYSLSFSGGKPHVSVSSPITRESIGRSATLADALDGKDYLDRVAKLLFESSKRETDSLFAFIAAWSALEVFIGASFKNIYQKKWYEMLEAGVPGSANLVIKRFETVMSDKLRLTDKFAVIASMLDAENAEADIGTFQTIKKVRDGFYHSPEPTGADFPLHDTQLLLRKYLRLHLMAAL